jgi:hypothetical protein
MRVQEFIRPGGERGIALITTLLIMMLMSALLVGFTTVVMSDQRYRLIDRDRVRSFYAAHSGLEKLNVDLGNLFMANVAPTSAQVAALGDNPPSIPDVTFIDSGDAAYGVTIMPPRPDCSDPCYLQVGGGPYAGLIALKKEYWLDATARTADGGETHLRRKVETVAIPVFQFGLFSDVDLSFHAGPNFNFGGRVHSNGSLFLAHGDGATLTLPSKVTAVKEIIRKQLANGVAIPTSGHTGTVRVATAPGAYRNLADNEGSVTGGPNSSANASWPTISLSTYNGYLRTGLTGARPLNLPLITTGGANVDLIKRPVQNENSTNPTLLEERYFTKASLRILLSDSAADITGLPTVTSTPPVRLDGNWRTTPPNNGAVYGPVDPAHPPIARSPGRVIVNANLPTVGAAVAASTNTIITVSNPTAANAVLPVEFKLPSTGTQYYSLTVNKGGTLYPVTCKSKTISSPYQFTGCVTTSPPGSSPVSTSSPTPTLSAALPNNTLVSTNITANWASPWSTITVANLTELNKFDPNTFTVKVIKGAQIHIAHCGVKTATSFTNCIPEAIPTPAPVQAPATVRAENVPNLDTADNIDAPLTSNWQSSSSAWLSWATIAVGSTLPYSTNTFWVLNTNGTNVLVTCLGFQNTNQLTGCNVPANLTANAQITSAALSAPGTGVIGGFIKIERQDTNQVWQDVTMEILNHGIAGPNLSGKPCNDPTPNAIIRLQRLRDNAEPGGGNCSYQGTRVSSDFWPNVIFDTREALYRDVGPGNTNLYLGGVMHYVAIDAQNLAEWFKGMGVYAAGTGTQSLSDNGFSVYFSDRRGNRNESNQETAEFGFEDIINPLSAAGTPNGLLNDPSAPGARDAGEDANENGTLETYGQFPHYSADGAAFIAAPPGAAAPLDAAARPTTLVRGPYALVNRALLFRRGLKLTNGGTLFTALDPSLAGGTGLTVAAENPVYIHGSWNWDPSAPDDLNRRVGTSIAADAVTILSSSWNDLNSINFGTDGGAHNCLRMLEAGGGTVNYRGSIATFYFARQGVGVYKCCSTVYAAPTRNYNFDTDFLNPARLPPLTPMFRDTNSLGFAQEVRPGK